MYVATKNMILVNCKIKVNLYVTMQLKLMLKAYQLSNQYCKHEAECPLFPSIGGGDVFEG